MSDFLDDPSVLTKNKLKSALLAHNVPLPTGDQRKHVYVQLYLKNLTAQNKTSGSPDVFSSDEDLPPAPVVSNKSRSGRKSTRKTDKVPAEENNVSELTNEGLKDLLLKYGLNAGPIVASTRKVYEKRLQKLLDQGPPETVAPPSELLQTDGKIQNGDSNSDQYSDREEETVAPAPVFAPEPELVAEPVPVVERPVRSRGKTPVTTRTRSGWHNGEDKQGRLNIKKKLKTSSHWPDLFPLVTTPKTPDSQDRRRTRPMDYSDISIVKEVSVALMRIKVHNLAVPKEPKPSKCPSISEFDRSESPKRHNSPFRSTVCKLHEDAPIEKVEKVSVIDQTLKMVERDVLKEIFPNENLSTPTGISATCRRPIKGVAGRPLDDSGLKESRLHHTELRETSTSYTETRSVPQLAAVPLPASKPVAPPAVQTRARHNLPVWVQLLLLSIVAGFLIFVYQAMETNEAGLFKQSGADDSTSK